MEAPLLVTGGTGTIGRRVVPLLREAGRAVRVLSRHPRVDEPGVEHVGGDTVSGRGLESALDGVDTVLHLAGGARGDDIAARRLGHAAREAGVRHLVLVSVTGADRMPIGYFRAKAAAEREVIESGVPWTILRSAQLHDFVLPIARALTALPVAFAPRGLRFEPVAVDAVATRLAELTLGRPAGRVSDITGPEVIDARELVTAHLAAHARRRPIVEVGMPGAVGRAYRAGANLAENALRTGSTWAEFLGSAHVPRVTAS